MKTTTFEVHTGRTPVAADITRQCEQFAREASGGGAGLLHIFVPHATAGLAVLELGAGSRTARAGTGARTCCRRSSRRTRHCP